MGDFFSLARLPAAALIGAALAFASCGESRDSFTSGESARAQAALSAVARNVNEGRCEAAKQGVSRLALQSTHINDDRPELGQAWAASVTRLNTLVMRECTEIQPSQPSPAATTPETGPTEVTPPVEPVKPPTDQTDGDGGSDGGDGGGTGTNPGGGETPAPDNSGGAGPGV